MSPGAKIRRAWPWLAVYAAVALIPPLLMDTEHGAAFSWTAAYLLLPIVGLAAWIDHLMFPRPRRERRDRLIHLLTLGMFAGLIFLVTTPLVLTLNAILPPQSHLVVEGTVVEKRVMRHRGALHILKLNTPDGLVELEVTPDEFHRIRETQVFQQERRIGPMGITYRWIWERNK